jgi:hypothetical protein
MIPGSINALLLGEEAGAAGGYSISRSLRFNAPDSAFLSRTPASAGNRTTWTWAGWIKRSQLGVLQRFFSGATATNDNDWTAFLFNSSDQLVIGGYNVFFRTSNSVYRDCSAWYHLVITANLGSGTDALKLRAWINNTEVTWASTSTNPTTTGINSANNHTIGAEQSPNNGGVGSYFNGYLADIHFIDGQALDPTSFGEFSATTGVWMPKAYSGSYGTNGFKLNFSDNSTAAALGTDSSGNGNTWSVNNLSVTAGAGNDSLIDVPTNGSEVDTGLGGQMRGNYTVLNALSKGSNVTLSNGNLESSHAGSSVHSRVVGTIGVSSGKWYYEATLTTLGGQWPAVGVALSKTTDMATYVGAESGTFGYYAGGGVNGSGGGRTYSSYTTGDVIGVAIDLDNNRLTFYKNGANAVTSGTTYESLTAGEVYVSAASGYGSSAAWACNFGQRPFAYTAPSGFKALNTANLPAPLVTKPNQFFDVALYAGNGTARTITLPGDLSTDFVWIKSRSDGSWHILTDSVRGVNSQLYSNDTSSEGTQTDRITSFNSNGFSLGTNGSGGVNNSGTTYVAWCWDAGSSTVTNTAGSITSQVRANATAGFSVVTYTGNLSSNGNVTVGHGLGVAPQLVITKARSASSRWAVQMPTALSANNYLELNSTSAQASWGGQTRANPTSTVFDTIYAGGVNESGVTYVAYCFAPVAGYSSFGSYTGNGSADGPFVYTGFRPRWLLIKNSGGGASSSVQGWVLQDTARSAYNVTADTLFASNSNASSSSSIYGIDILSNGFKTRGTDGAVNESSATYIYAAFAEHPFQFSRAR